MYNVCCPQALDTLVEVVQNPCPENQRALAGSRLPHVLNRLLQARPEP